MDPVTALLNVIIASLELVKTAMEGQPPDVRAEFWRMHLEDTKALRAWLEPLLRPRT